MKIRNYQLIHPPFTPNFYKDDKKKLQEYFDWFARSVDERIRVLTEAVHASQGCHNWKPDYSPESLEKLGYWFAAHVKRRLMTHKEQKLYRASFDTDDFGKKLKKAGFADNDLILTELSFSLCMDIGMYISVVFLKNHPELSWAVKLTGSRNHIDFGQPVLKGFMNRNLFNPFHIMQTIAIGISEHSWTGDELKKTYDYWAENNL